MKMRPSNERIKPLTEATIFLQIYVCYVLANTKHNILYTEIDVNYDKNSNITPKVYYHIIFWHIYFYHSFTSLIRLKQREVMQIHTPFPPISFTNLTFPLSLSSSISVPYVYIFRDNSDCTFTISKCSCLTDIIIFLRVFLWF